MRLAPILHLALGFCLAVLVSANPTSAKQPTLSGTVMNVLPEGNAPLPRARVELLSPGTNQVKYGTYTGPTGRYAFWQVAAGTYDLRVKFGRRVLNQVIGGRPPTKRQRIKLTASPARLVVTVRTG